MSVLSDKKSLKLVADDFSNAKKFRGAKETAWNEYYQLYRAYLDTSKYPWRSNVFIPYAFWTIETILPRLVANKPRLLVEARNIEDEPKAKVFGSLIDWQWDMMGMALKIEHLVREGMKYGTSFLKIGWNERDGIPEIENCDILDLYVDPYATSLKDTRFVIFRTFRTKDEIKNNKNYQNTDALEALKSSDAEGRKAQRYSIQDMGAPDTATGGERIEVLEYWTSDRLIVIAGNTIVLRDEKNPFTDKKIPFVLYRDYPVAFEFYGIGEIEHIKSQQEEGNSIRNQMLDNNNLINNPMYTSDPTANLNVRNLISKPGAVVPKGLTPFQHPQLSNKSFDLEQEIKADVQQTTGVTDYQIGGDVGGGTKMNKTATGIHLIQEAGNQRFKIKLDHLEQTIKDLGEMLLSRNQQFLNKDTVVRVVGEEGIVFQEITAEDIVGSFDIKPEAGSTTPVNKDIEREQIKDMVGQLAQLQQISMGALQVNWFELATRMVNKYGIKDVNNIIKQGQPIPPMPPPGQEGAPQEGGQVAPEGQGAPPQGGGEVAPEIEQMLQQLGPDGVAKFIQTLPPQDQQIMNSQLQKLAQQGG